MLKCKKILTFVIVSLLLFSFIGCNRTDSGSQTTSTTTTGQATTLTTAPVETVIEYRDIPVIRRLMHDDGVRRNTAQEVRVHEKIKELIGVDVQMILVPGDQFNNRVNLMIASRDPVDIFARSLVEATNMLRDGIIHGITDEMMSTIASDALELVSQDSWMKVKVDGMYLGFPHEPAVRINGTFHIRTDWLEKLNMDMPRTIDELEMVFEAFLNNDLNETGRNDIIPFTTDRLSRLYDAMTPAFLPEASGYWLSDSGEVMPPEMHPGYKEMLRKLNEWYEKGYLHSEFHIAQQSQIHELYAQNRIGVHAGWWSVHALHYMSLTDTVPGYDTEIVLIEGENGINKFSLTEPTGSVHVITQMCDDVEAAMRYMNFMCTKEGHFLTMFGIEGDNYIIDSNGYVNFILDEGTTTVTNEAKYYGLYGNRFTVVSTPWRSPNAYFIAGPLFERYNNILLQYAELPQFNPIDMFINYDRSEWESADRIGDMNTYLDEQKVRVIIGDLAPDDWDDVMNTWLQMGGELYIRDKTRQFNEAK